MANIGTMTTQNSRKRVPFYTDENAVSGLLPEQNEEYMSVPLPEDIGRENQLQPGRWNDTRVGIVIILYYIHCIIYNIIILYYILLYGLSKCASVIGSNGVTWYKINFTTDCTHSLIWSNY